MLLCTAGSQFEVFVLGRVLTGVAVGGEFTAIFSAVDEFLPPKVRGRVDIVIDGSWYLGALLGAGINYVVGEFEYWRYLFAVGLLGVLAVSCIRRSIP